jgi:hypothetical protein
MLAAVERLLDRRFRRIAVAADQFDEHVDFGIGGQRDGIVEPAIARQIVLPAGLVARSAPTPRRPRAAARCAPPWPRRARR